MSTLLIKHAHILATMDDLGREIPDGALFVRDHVMDAVGTTAELADLSQSADEVLALTDHVVLPGLTNTHHHMYQSLTRAIPAAQDKELFDWLTALYGIWRGLTPDMVYTSALTAMAELMLSGCTTASEHLYIDPNGAQLAA